MGKNKKVTDYRQRLIITLKILGAPLKANAYSMKLSEIEELCRKYNIEPGRFKNGWPTMRK